MNQGLEILIPLAITAAIFIIPIRLIWKTIKRRQDRKQFEAETERMRAEAEMLKAKKEPKFGSDAHFEAWKENWKKEHGEP